MLLHAKNGLTAVCNWLHFTVLIVVCGSAVGAATALFLQTMHFLIRILWPAAASGWLAFSVGGVSFSLYPVVLCAFGGVLIGLWQKKFGPYPQTLEDVVKLYRQEKDLPYRPVAIVCAAALLPLAFAGSIGPEAGLAGILVMLCCWARDCYKQCLLTVLEQNGLGRLVTFAALLKAPLKPHIGTTLCENGKTVVLSRRERWPIYAVMAACGFFAFRLASRLLAQGSLELARFPAYTFKLGDLLFLVPLILLGGFCGSLFWLGQKLAAALWRPFANRPVLRAVLAGALLGLVGVFFPYTLFSGEDQLVTLANTWQGWAVPALFATGFVKLLLINLCIFGGWRGGCFFPSLFCSAAIGFGLLYFLPAAPGLVVPVFMAAYTAAALGQPAIVAALCFLFAPFSAWLPTLLAAFCGGWVRRRARPLFRLP